MRSCQTSEPSFVAQRCQPQSQTDVLKGHDLLVKVKPQANSSAPLVSVVIPVYNRAAQVAAAIDSVTAQSLTDIEIVIVDDGSTDATVERVEAIEDARIRVLRHDRNRGANAARNTGVREATGAYVAFQDSDDHWHTDKLEIQLKSAREHDAKVCFCALSRIHDNNQQVIPKPSYRVPSGLSCMTPLLLRGSFISCQTLLIDRHLLKTVGLFDEALPRLQDWELCIRLSQAAPFFYIDRALVDVHLSANSISRDFAKYAAAIEHILNKHEQLFAYHPIARKMLQLNVAALSVVNKQPGVLARSILPALWPRPDQIFPAALEILRRR